MTGRLLCTVSSVAFPSGTLAPMRGWTGWRLTVGSIAGFLVFFGAFLGLLWPPLVFTPLLGLAVGCVLIWTD